MPSQTDAVLVSLGACVESGGWAECIVLTLVEFARSGERPSIVDVIVTANLPALDVGWVAENTELTPIARSEVVSIDLSVASVEAELRVDIVLTVDVPSVVILVVDVCSVVLEVRLRIATAEAELAESKLQVAAVDCKSVSCVRTDN